VNQSRKHRETTDSWDVYWRSSRDVAAFSDPEGLNHPELRQFWLRCFDRLRTLGKAPVLLDVATGRGTVIETAQQFLRNSQADYFCVDSSVAAIESVGKRLRSVHGCVADAAFLPIASQSMDMVTSQYGFEYAGISAIHELTRVVKVGGILALVLHSQEGNIYRQCRANLDAIAVLKKREFLSLAREMFRQGFAACRGGDPALFRSAAAKVVPAFKALEPVMDKFGVDVAGGMIANLYNNVAKIQQRIQHYREDEVVRWLERTEEELTPYIKRMQSMRDAAISRDTFNALCTTIRNDGFSLHASEPLSVGSNQLPLAWTIVGVRQ